MVHVSTPAPRAAHTAPVAPVWIDCDPGNDDAFALLLGAFHPNFNLLGVSTVFGNVSVDKTTKNTLALFDVLGLAQDDVKVYAGEAEPFRVERVDAAYVHGASGMGGIELPQNPRIAVSQDVHYLDAMRRAVLANEGEIVIVCTGALTNFARFIEKYPEDLAKIKHVSIMGGSFDCGNVTPHAEFNIRVDPHAASYVFGCEALAGKIILAPLNITHRAVATEDVLARIYTADGTNNSPLRLMFRNLIEFYAGSYRKRYPNYSGPPIHDPLALFLVLPLLALSMPEYRVFADACNLEYLQRKLSVTHDGEQIGKTTYAPVHLDPLYVDPRGVMVAMHVNIPIFWDFMLAALDIADKHVSGSQC